METPVYIDKSFHLFHPRTVRVSYSPIWVYLGLVEATVRIAV